MFDRRAHSLALHTGDIGHCKPGREERVFGITLEVAAIDRRAMNIDRGREQHPRTLGLRFFCQSLPNLVYEREVPTGGEGDAHRKTGCFHTTDQAPSATRAVWSVR